jgi:hypothetical protein
MFARIGTAEKISEFESPEKVFEFVCGIKISEVAP